MGLIQSGSFSSNYFASGAIKSGHLADGCIVSGSIGSGHVAWSHFASGSLLGSASLTGHAIASRTLNGQTSSNSGTIVTVSGTGMYRVSSYALVTLGGLLNAGNMSFRVDWTDENQLQNVSPITGVALSTSGAFGQGSAVVRALSGTAIIGTVTLSSLTGSPTYDAFMAVERLT